MWNYNYILDFYVVLLCEIESICATVILTIILYRIASMYGTGDVSERNIQYTLN